MRKFPAIDREAENAAFRTLFFQDSVFEGKPRRVSVANYLAFLRLQGPKIQEEVAKLRSALAQPAPAQIERDLTLLLRARNWRFHNIACIAIACNGASETLLSELWRCLRSGSWSSPQLAATAAYIDPDFQRKATLAVEDNATHYKSIVSIATLLAAVSPEFQLSEAARANLSEATTIDRDDSGTIAVEWHKNLVEIFIAA